MKTLLFIVLSSFACASAYAKPPVKTLFSCTTTNGKQLTVQRQGADYIYSFGRKGHPELVFRNSKWKVFIRSHNVNGNSPYAKAPGDIRQEMNMINRGYQYNIFFRVSGQERTVKRGVEVTKLSRINDATYSPWILLCDERYPIIDNRELEMTL